MLSPGSRRRTFPWAPSTTRFPSSIAAVALLAATLSPALQAQTGSKRADPPAAKAVTLMVKHEIADHRTAQSHHAFRFLSIERSARTGGHLWTEEVVEVDGGLLRRLIAVDGKPLTPAQQAAEKRRLQQIVSNPSQFERLNRNRDKDEARVVKVLKRMPREFLFRNEGPHNGCERIAFRPNPAYQPDSFEDRVVHNMAGTINIEEPAMRLCSVSAHLTKTVDFGFGILGHVSRGGGFTLDRTQVEHSVWRSTLLNMHFDGDIFFFKSISRNQHTVRRDFQPVPANLDLQQAVALSRPSRSP